MIQNIAILLIVAICIWYIGRRLYTNLKGSQSGCGCGCSCSGCESEASAACNQKDQVDSTR